MKNQYLLIIISLFVLGISWHDGQIFIFDIANYTPSTSLEFVCEVISIPIVPILLIEIIIDTNVRIIKSKIRLWGHRRS